MDMPDEAEILLINTNYFQKFSSSLTMIYARAWRISPVSSLDSLVTTCSHRNLSWNGPFEAEAEAHDLCTASDHIVVVCLDVLA